MDFWVYQEIIFALRPDVVIDIGNHYGGSLLAYAHWLDHMGHGRLIGVDIDHDVIADAVRRHPRVTLVTGDACEQFGEVRKLVRDEDTVLIIDDSAHTYDNTLNVLRTYGGLVSVGSYFIVEDSNCHHGIDIGPKPGAYEAIADFLKDHPEYESDRSRESFFITWNPMGYLRRQEPLGSWQSVPDNRETNKRRPGGEARDAGEQVKIDRPFRALPIWTRFPGLRPGLA